MQTWCDSYNQVSPTLAYMQAKHYFCLILDPTENNMLNVRIVKGGCRGREAVRFGVVSINFLLPLKSQLVQLLHSLSRNLPFEVKLHAKIVVSGGKIP